MYQLTEKESRKVEGILKSVNSSEFEFVSRGFSSVIFKVKKNKEFFALKIEREKSSRTAMAKREAAGLKNANSIGIGPKLFFWNEKKGFILMEYINGLPFNKWISKKHEKKDVFFVVKNLYFQAKKLDEISLVHSQLAGKGKNIIVCKKKEKFFPVIIDFEKSGFREKPRNVFQVSSFLWKKQNSFIAKKLVFLLGKKWWKRLPEA